MNISQLPDLSLLITFDRIPLNQLIGSQNSLWLTCRRWHSLRSSALARRTLLRFDMNPTTNDYKQKKQPSPICSLNSPFVTIVQPLTAQTTSKGTFPWTNELRNVTKLKLLFERDLNLPKSPPATIAPVLHLLLHLGPQLVELTVSFGYGQCLDEHLLEAINYELPALRHLSISLLSSRDEALSPPPLPANFRFPIAAHQLYSFNFEISGPLSVSLYDRVLQYTIDPQSPLRQVRIRSEELQHFVPQFLDDGGQQQLSLKVGRRFTQLADLSLNPSWLNSESLSRYVHLFISLTKFALVMPDNLSLKQILTCLAAARLPIRTLVLVLSKASLPVVDNDDFSHLQLDELDDEADYLPGRALPQVRDLGLMVPFPHHQVVQTFKQQVGVEFDRFFPALEEVNLRNTYRTTECTLCSHGPRPICMRNCLRQCAEQFLAVYSSDGDKNNNRLIRVLVQHQAGSDHLSILEWTPELGYKYD